MVNPLQSGLRAATRRAGWSLAFSAAAILLLVSQGVESPRIAAQGQSIVDGTLEVHYEDRCRRAAARTSMPGRSALRSIQSKSAGTPADGRRVRVRGARRNGMLVPTRAPTCPASV
jgi:hypothetical protein